MFGVRRSLWVTIGFALLLVPAVALDAWGQAAKARKPPAMGAEKVTDSQAQWPQPPKAPSGAPNIVLILLDDVGFAATSVRPRQRRGPHAV